MSEKTAQSDMGSVDPPEVSTEAAPKGHPPQFWLVMVGLGLLAFISALDTMIVITALPTITKQIGGAAQYVWIGNSFVFATSVVQPLVGQLSDLLGRKIPILVSIALFMLGSGIAGGAHNPATLIGGRVVQGLGAGGIYVLIDIVTCDLVPARGRGKYLALVNAWAGVAAALGPVLGGVFGEKNWRWIFWINVPICVLPMGTVLFVMKTKTGDRTKKLRDLDYVGALIFVPSIVAVLFGLVTGGVQHPWSSWRVILPLTLGGVGWICFHIQQHFSSNPLVPTRLFSNRTSAVGFALGFISSVAIQTAAFFLPVYFQAVRGTTVFASGIDFLPTAIGVLVAAAIAGILLSKFGAYRPIHAASFAFHVIGFGLFTLLDSNTRPVAWVFFQLILVAGAGPVVATILPAILAGLPTSDVASASAAFSFLKTFGYTWGVTISSVIFNGVFNKHLGNISSSTLREQLKDGAAYSFASQARSFRATIDPSVWSEVIQVYLSSLGVVWWFGLGLSAFGFLLVFLERDLTLATELSTEYGLDDSEKKQQTGEIANP